MLQTSRQSHAILVVDDNESIHHDFDRILGRHQSAEDLARYEAAFYGQAAEADTVPYGFQVDHALQCDVAVSMVQQAVACNQPYAVAFIDVTVTTAGDDFALVDGLWQADPDLSIVICTASLQCSREELDSRVTRPGQLLILRKPFDTLEVTQLASALSSQRSQRQAVQRQVTELQQQIEQRIGQLVQAQQESERLIEAISSVVVGIDEHGRISRWNATSESVFGVSAKDIIGRPFHELPVQWEDLELAERLLLNEQQQASRRNELIFTDADGNRRVLGASVFPVLINGCHRGRLVLGADLTENRLLEQQLQAAHKLEAVGQLAAGVAHEINTPMQYIGDNLEYLTTAFDELISQLHWYSRRDESAIASEMPVSVRRLDSLQKNVPSALSDSIEGVTHVSRIVRAMKEFSHPGMETKMSVDVNAALQTTLTVTSNEWKHVATVMTDFGVPARPIDAFAGELNQVFLNLIMNAVQAIEESAVRPGRIDVGTRYTDDFVEIRISDTGCGIPEEIRGRIFDPFFTTKEVGRGTGQGLALAHTVIVQKHGGRLWFETDDQAGTTFLVQLPYLSAPETEDVIAEQSIGVA